MKIASKALLLCGVLWSIAAFSASKDLKVGDIWAYKNRPGEDGSTLTILKIEHYPKLGKVVHIRVNGFRMINPVTGNEFNDMPHLPFQAKALERSITHRIGETAEIPDFNQGTRRGERPSMKEAPGLSRSLCGKHSMVWLAVTGTQVNSQGHLASSLGVNIRFTIE
jgi:hypothetical protein